MTYVEYLTVHHVFMILFLSKSDFQLDSKAYKRTDKVWTDFSDKLDQY